MEATDRTRLYGYKVDGMLGKGGSSTVYRAIHPETGQVVALKLFRANFFQNRFHVREFLKNVKVFKQFSHPNVMRIFDFIEGEEGYCLVQEYIDGPDLKWYMLNRPFDLQERLMIVAQVCNGLQYLHDQGYTHHDLKPGNVIFTRKGVAKLCDFSLCRTKLFKLWGGALKDLITPMYISPELIKKEKDSPKSDIYSLGITLYQLFAGGFPFQADSLDKIYYCHLHLHPEHPSDVNPKCPRPLGDIIMKCLEKKPERRFDDCDQLRIALSEVGRSRI